MAVDSLSPRQKLGRTGLPDDGIDGAALAPYRGLPVAQVQVLDVAREHLGGPRGRPIEHPPEGLSVGTC